MWMHDCTSNNCHLITCTCGTVDINGGTHSYMCMHYTYACPMCLHCRWCTVRIDGGVQVDERQSIVDRFNGHGVGQVGQEQWG